jgi:large subunit ribosomal protein L10
MPTARSGQASEAACGDERFSRFDRALSTPGRAVHDPLDLQSRGLLVFRAARKEHTMERAQKEKVLGEIKEAFQNVSSVIIADYRGIKVPTVTTMRDDFRKAGCYYRVLKNSLVKIAVKGSKMEPLSTLMVGTTAVIWSNEAPQPPAQLALKWAKDVPKFIIRGGYFEGQLLDLAGVDALARMPGKNEMRASMLMTFLAAPQSFVAQIIAGPQNFAYLLDARKRQLEKGE